MAERIVNHRQLEVYQRAFSTSMTIFEISKLLPREELFSLTDQIRRSSRSVAANIAEAWRKRRYEAAFIAKLSDAEAEAAETQTWLEYTVKCGYIARERIAPLYREYDQILRTLVGMINHTNKWILPARKPSRVSSEPE